MTLKEELEILRGEPIQVFDGDPMDIPCIETSDPVNLCKRPIVSVSMITYNHERYIRQAIEGVMRQKTDFEFELIIGEDCSQDKTREICFEYQKKYPDKIRVLWWHENVSKLGGNGRRVRAHCRGEFIAYCEGDDYWIDPLKLQKQVDIMQTCSNVCMCFCSADDYCEKTDCHIKWDWEGAWSPGETKGIDFSRKLIFGVRNGEKEIAAARFIRTSTAMVRKAIVYKMLSHFEIFKWRLFLGDLTLWLGCGFLGDVYFLPDTVSVYRLHEGGVTSRRGSSVAMDSYLVRIWYLVEGLGYGFFDAVHEMRKIFPYCLNALKDMGLMKQIKYAKIIKSSFSMDTLAVGENDYMYWRLCTCGMFNNYTMKQTNRLLHVLRVLGLNV